MEKSLHEIDPAQRIESMSPDYYRKIFQRTSELSRMGVWECDLATETLAWTDMVYDLFDFPKQSPVSRSATLACYEPRSRREMEVQRARAIATCTGFTVDVGIRTPRGVTRWVRINGDVEHEDGKAVRIFGTKQDITREKTAQLELEALQAKLMHLSHQSAVNAMGSTVAHALNQPLAAIANYASALREKLGRENHHCDDELQMLEGIHGCSLRAGVILRDLYSHARPTFQNQTAFEVESEIRQACAIALAGNADDPPFAYTFCGGLRAKGDPVQFQQVIINLVRIARDAMLDLPGKEVAISTAASGNYVEISVCKNGRGVDPEIGHFLNDALASNKLENSGLGLAICRTIIESFGGSLSVADRTGTGALFHFTLPLAERAESVTC